MTEADLIQAGEDAVAAAESWWHDLIRDPKHNETTPRAHRDRAIISSWITHPLTGSGWKEWQCGRTGEQHDLYCGDRCASWCGFFAGACWGSRLTLDARKRFLPSTLRLAKWARLDPARRITDLALVRAGDIVTVETSGKLPDEGDHITIARGPITGRYSSVGGNETGKGPDGVTYQGVVIGDRPTSKIRRVYRPLLTDLVGP